MKKYHKRAPILLVLIMVAVLSAQTTVTKHSFTRRQLMPDLAITNIFVDKNCYVIVTVENLGPGNLPEGAYIPGHPQVVSFYYEIKYRESPYSRNTIGNSGSTVLKLFDEKKKLKKAGGKIFHKLGKVGSYTTTVTAFIDSVNNLKERHENNNKAVKASSTPKTWAMKMVAITW